MPHTDVHTHSLVHKYRLRCAQYENWNATQAGVSLSIFIASSAQT